MKRHLFWIPFVLFVGLCWVLVQALQGASSVDFPLLNKPAPVFQGANNTAIFTNKITLVNFWATWCSPCREEHAVLLEIAKDYPVSIIGINYKDESMAALQWLDTLGDPYQVLFVDTQGKIGIEWGVVAIPETFIVDASGIVRYKHTGPLTLALWKTKIWPFVIGKGSSLAPSPP